MENVDVDDVHVREPPQIVGREDARLAADAVPGRRQRRDEARVKVDGVERDVDQAGAGAQHRPDLARQVVGVLGDAVPPGDVLAPDEGVRRVAAEGDGQGAAIAGVRQQCADGRDDDFGQRIHCVFKAWSIYGFFTPAMASNTKRTSRKASLSGAREQCDGGEGYSGRSSPIPFDGGQDFGVAGILARLSALFERRKKCGEAGLDGGEAGLDGGHDVRVEGFLALHGALLDSRDGLFEARLGDRNLGGIAEDAGAAHDDAAAKDAVAEAMRCEYEQWWSERRRMMLLSPGTRCRDLQCRRLLLF